MVTVLQNNLLCVLVVVVLTSERMDINSRSETRESTANSEENLISPNRDGVAINISQLSVKPLCRICYSSSESLIRPCECRGTIEYVHLHCLERWLEEKNNDSCDLCQHQFQTRRSRKSFRQMLGDSAMRKYVIVYCTFMAIVISPFIAATWMFWISTEAFIFYIKKYGWTLYTASGFFLPFALGVGVIACFSMIILFTRDFFTEFKDWRNRNWNIRIVDRLSPDVTTGSDTDNSVIIPRNPTQDSTIFPEQPAVRYARDINGREYLAIVNATSHAHVENEITWQDVKGHLGRPYPEITTGNDIDNSMNILRVPTQDLTVFTEQPAVRYARDINDREYHATISTASRARLENGISRQDVGGHIERGDEIV